ncbi:MAG: radical SAM family heme chaperone HemW [Oceanospirillales bacterium]|nr:MAG: radical SAM family heme chaperone HemW [Oceanospirillales bacterium]
MTQPAVISLYVHIPWCIRKCPYCDFNSHAQRDEALPETAYIDALIRDLTFELNRLDSPRPLHSIFIGGGTPSLFSAESIHRLLHQIDQQMPISSSTEITLEANPGTFEQQKFAGFRAAGINRISLGIQSFHDKQLKALGRVHNAENAIQAATSAIKLFDRVNLDLMHGLPEQQTEQALKDLQQAIDLGPEHLSWYQLTLEPNTEFHARPPQLPVDEALWEIQEQGQELLRLAGFQQYEISAYARQNAVSQHNMNYWTFGDYIGIGAGAHGKVSHWDSGKLRIERHQKQRQPKGYLQAVNPTQQREWVDEDELAFEFMLNALRLYSGVPASLFAERTGLSLEQIHKPLALARAKGLLTENSDRLEPTPQGRLFLNDLLEQFL